MNNINTLGHYIASLQQSISSISMMVTNINKDVKDLETRLKALESKDYEVCPSEVKTDGLKDIEERVKALEDYNESINKTLTENAPVLSNFPAVLGLDDEPQEIDIEIVPKKKKVGKKGQGV